MGISDSLQEQKSYDGDNKRFLKFLTNHLPHQRQPTCNIKDIVNN
jgi:hypothetical protein